MKRDKIMLNIFKMLIDKVEYTVTLKEGHFTDGGLYVSIKEGEWKYVLSSEVKDEAKKRIELVYGKVSYITGTD